ncbi:MAG: winged helix-turn-helix transcriptional regulator [Clostridia bacterium]|nr:winged helix-turn-helix transcriptional regulator [Clostridia bacterium]
MNNIKIEKSYGVLYDINLIFILRFNKKFFFKEFINPAKADEDTELYNKLYEEYSNISPLLLPFFYIKDKNNRCLFSNLRSECINDTDAKKDNVFEVLYSKLTDTEGMKSRVLNHYFPDAVCNEKDGTFIELADGLIKNSNFDDSLKTALYSFFINSKSIITLFINEIKAVQTSISEKWEGNKDELLSFVDRLDFNTLANMCNIDISAENITVSPCLLAKNSCITASLGDDGYVFIIGLNYADFIEDDLSYVKLEEFGNAVSEKNRIAILNVILENEEVTIKDIEQRLKLTGTNSYYHLSLMLKANMIKARNVGKTVYYSINKMYFSALSRILEKYK